MQLEIEQHADHCVLRLIGELVISHAIELKDALLDALNDCQQLEIDLAEISDLDSAGMQLLLLLKREALASHKDCHLSNHSSVVVDMLETYQLIGYFGDPLVISAR